MFPAAQLPRNPAQLPVHVLSHHLRHRKVTVKTGTWLTSIGANWRTNPSAGATLRRAELVGKRAEEGSKNHVEKHKR